MSDKDKIRNRYIQMYQGMTEKDGELLENVLHPDFVLMHMTGMCQTKEEFIQAVQNGTLNYDSVRHRSIDVRLHENEAELTGKSLVHASVFGGRWNTWRLQINCSLKKENNIWMITSAKASTF